MQRCTMLFASTYQKSVNSNFQRIGQWHSERSLRRGWVTLPSNRRCPPAGSPSGRPSEYVATRRHLFVSGPRRGWLLVVCRSAGPGRGGPPDGRSATQTARPSTYATTNHTHVVRSAHCTACFIIQSSPATDTRDDREGREKLTDIHGTPSS